MEKMAVSYMDFTSPNTQFTFDLSKNRFFTKNENNYINGLGVKQLNTLGNTSLLDIFLTTGNVIEPHIHQNATELVYCISGAAVVSIINPFTLEVLNYSITPGQVANVPQGWFHWEVATEDHTHLLAIFDAPEPEFIGVSDFLRLAPRDMLAHTYCLDEEKLKQTLAPITSTTVIGPPANCGQVQQTQTHTQSQVHTQSYTRPGTHTQYLPPFSPETHMQNQLQPQIYPEVSRPPINPAYRQRNPYSNWSRTRPTIGNGFDNQDKR